MSFLLCVCLLFVVNFACHVVWDEISCFYNSFSIIPLTEAIFNISISVLNQIIDFVVFALFFLGTKKYTLEVAWAEPAGGKFVQSSWFAKLLTVQESVNSWQIFVVCQLFGDRKINIDQLAHRDWNYLLDWKLLMKSQNEAKKQKNYFYLLSKFNVYVQCTHGNTQVGRIIRFASLECHSERKNAAKFFPFLLTATHRQFSWI